MLPSGKVFDLHLVVYTAVRSSLGRSSFYDTMEDDFEHSSSGAPIPPQDGFLVIGGGVAGSTCAIELKRCARVRFASADK